MKNIRNKSLLFAGLAATAACILFAVSATGGNLEPASPPAPTMHSLDEIYNMAGSVGMPVWPLGAAKTRSLAYINIANLTIPGESNEASHNNWIETLSASYMLSQPSNTAAGSNDGGKGERTGTKVAFSELYFVKEIDRATPVLAKGCANGKRYNTVVIDFTRTIAGSRKIYLKMTLSDVTISSIMSVMSPRAQNDFTHLEQVSLRYSKIEWLYSRYNESTGALIDTTQERWDVAKNRDY
jgi:type VI secretion system secreted protein Hcp